MPDPTEPNAVVFPFYSRLNIDADDAFIFGNLEPVVADGLGFTIRPPLK